jgi:hypothetical protein
MGSSSLKIAEALKGVNRIGIDSTPLIYLLEKHPLYFDRMKVILEYLTSGSITAYSSTLTLVEVLVQPFKTGDQSLVRQYEAILMNSP